MSISCLSIFNVIYIFSISFQIAGALLLLLYLVSTKRENVIRRFVGKGLLTRKGDMVEYNQDAYKNEYHIAYLNKLSFLLIAVGYLISIFGCIESVNKLLVLAGILLSTSLIMFLSVKGTSFLVNRLKSNDKITNKDLKDFDIKPDVDFITSEEIDLLWKNVKDTVDKEKK